ncbi:MAG: IS66 family transposase [Acidibrevibacterium sp.]|jgi:transposase|uniref:IS66 family transposase n=1 Tax=Acidibrevibacterium fodinaquatile TaxID=1969806 RepID=UPI0023A7D058|nr:IS66 family transposase [Acidibrevibacterium fodinaquatile]MCA7118297.1 IS66 family transposase [Acidibrevibacterium fodinaquatile]
MDIDSLALPDDIAALKEIVRRAMSRADAAEADSAAARAAQSDTAAYIEHLKLQIEKLKRALYGPRAERTARLLDQMELKLEELETTATEDELRAEQEAAKAKTTTVAGFTRKRPSRQPFPEHLPRERVVLPGPTQCFCCGGSRLAKLGESVTETLESTPRIFKVIQHVREKFTCRDCEKISQEPAPFHTIPRAFAGPSLLAMIAYDKFGLHQPLNRQSERFGLEGVPLSVSTLADLIGATCVALKPVYNFIKSTVFKAERIHGDDTTVPVLAQGQTDIARVWVYVRDDRPFGGSGPPCAVFYYSHDRAGIHPQTHLAEYSGVFQADAYGGYNKLYVPTRSPGPLIEAACWAHGRRKFFELADIARNAKRRAQGKTPAFVAPMALAALQRIDTLFEIERGINGRSPAERLAVRQQLCGPLVTELESWMRAERAKLSRHNDVAKAMDYMLNRWPAFTRFLTDGRICLTNNAAERALRTLALGRKSWLFAGSDRGGERAAMMYSLITTAKMNDVDPQAWLADTLARIANHPAQRIGELMPWNWIAPQNQSPAAQAA